jgi:hypothetical protein
VPVAFCRRAARWLSATTISTFSKFALEAIGNAGLVARVDFLSAKLVAMTAQDKYGKTCRVRSDDELPAVVELARIFGIADQDRGSGLLLRPAAPARAGCPKATPSGRGRLLSTCSTVRQDGAGEHIPHNKTLGLILRQGLIEPSGLEAGGIEPPSRDNSAEVSTCVVV